MKTPTGKPSGKPAGKPARGGGKTTGKSKGKPKASSGVTRHPGKESSDNSARTMTHRPPTVSKDISDQSGSNHGHGFGFFRMGVFKR